MPLLGLQDLWSNIIGCAAYCFLLLALMFQLCSQPKITNLQTVIGVQEEIPELQISMQHSTPVKIFQRNNELVYVKHRLGLRQPLAWALPHELIQRLVRTQLEDDVNILAVLEVVVEMYNLLVVQRSVYGNLRPELRMSPWLGNRRLGYDLGSKDLFRFQILHLIALGKAALPKKSTFVIPRGQTVLAPTTCAVLDDFHVLEICLGMGTAKLRAGHGKQLNNYYRALCN